MHKGEIGPLNPNKGNQDEEKDFQQRLCKLNLSKNSLDHGFNIWCLQKMQGIMVQSLALHYAIFQNFGMRSKHLLEFSAISKNNNKCLIKLSTTLLAMRITNCEPRLTQSWQQ